MAGPSLSGPLTGWTANTLTPIAKVIAAPRKQNPIPPAGMPDPATMTASQLEGWGRWEDAAIRRSEEVKARKATASALEKEAQATKDPAKLTEAWAALKRTAFDEAPWKEGGPANARVEAQHKLAVDFKKRNPAFEFPVDPAGFSQDKAIFEAPEGSVRSYLSKRLHEETGLGTGTQLDTDKSQKPRFLSSGGGGAPRAYADGTPVDTVSEGADVDPVPAPDLRSDVIGGLAPDYGAQVEGAAGGPSFSGPMSGWTQPPGIETPTTAFSPPTTPQTPNSFGPSGPSPTDKYNLTPSELGTPGPDPRISATPTTPLEQLLRTIYPDAPVSAGADPRSAGASNGFADVLAYINSQSGSGSGYVPAPVMNAPASGPSGGANIASGIPGAPSWLAPQIDALNRPYIPPAPAPSGGGGMNLAGLAAISAEQRVQQALLDAEEKRKRDAFLAQQAAAAEAKRIAANRAGAGGISSGWQSPFPTF